MENFRHPAYRENRHRGGRTNGPDRVVPNGADPTGVVPVPPLSDTDRVSRGTRVREGTALRSTTVDGHRPSVGVSTDARGTGGSR